jgi:hypothetical protein
LVKNSENWISPINIGFFLQKKPGFLKNIGFSQKKTVFSQKFILDSSNIW